MHLSLYGELVCKNKETCNRMQLTSLLKNRKKDTITEPQAMQIKNMTLFINYQDFARISLIEAFLVKV